ncbi:MAG: acetylxylan esterase [Bryobacterales bacterium]|nr:acetylxylan esterase [Bryobacterales bacterium]
MMRRTALLLIAASALAHGADWLETQLARPVLAPRQTTIESQVYFASLVPAMPPIADRAQWESYASQLRENILTGVVFRGEGARWRNLPTKAVWLDTLTGRGYRIRKFRYEAVPGMWLGGLLYEPEGLSGRVPAVINLNGHEGDGIANSYIQERCIHLARNGVIAINYEWFGKGQMSQPGFQHDRMNQLDLVGASGLAPFFLAMQRLVDIAVAHPNVDAARIAATGLSGGGWHTILLSSLDTRIKLIMPVAGYSSFVTRAQFPDMDLGDSEQTPNDLARFADYTHLTALLAPRPAQLTHNALDNCCFRADYALSPLLVAAKPIYALLGAADRLRYHVNFDNGHNYGLDNRQALYRFLGEHFFGGKFAIEEVPAAEDLRTPAQLRIPLPEPNETFQTLALKLSAALPVAGAGRADLKAITRWPEYQVQASQRSQEVADGVRITHWRLAMNGTWTVPAVEFEPVGPVDTVVLFGDAGRAALSGEVHTLLRGKHRVVAIDPYYFGESAMGSRDWLFALLGATVGERVLGIEASQVTAVARWLRTRHGTVRVSAQGPRTSVIALVAAAMEPGAISAVTLARPMRSLREVIEKNVSVSDAPELFCYGLLQKFDIETLKALAGKVSE